MPANNLQQLCEGFCEIARAAVPDLRAQGDGLVAFSVLWHDVAVEVIAKPGADPDHAFVLFDLGVPDLSRAELSRVLLALMHNNYMALRAGQPVFSCHPETDQVVLQWTVALQTATPAVLHQVIQEGVQLARQWRDHHFLPGLRADGADAVATPPAGAYA